MKNKLDFKTAFWIFMIGSFAGVIIEMFWCILKNGYIASRRGVIYGPFNPLYGVGALLMTYFLLPISDKKNIHIFFGGFVIGSIIEYGFHFAQGYFLGTYSWNYSNKFLNINGRIDLFHSICWGLLAIVWMRIVYPWLKKQIDKIKPKWNKVLIIVLGTFMVINMLISGIAVARWSARKRGEPAINKVDLILDKHYKDERMERIFPNMRMIKK